MKKCNFCHKVKDESLFKRGFECKDCARIKQKRWVQNKRAREAVEPTYAPEFVEDIYNPAPHRTLTQLWHGIHSYRVVSLLPKMQESCYVQ